MKKSLLLLAVLAITMSAQAQHEEGDVTIQPRVGVTFSNITGDDLFSEDTKMKVNVTYGFEVEYSFTDKFSIAGGLLFTDQGYKFDYYEGVEPGNNFIKKTAKFNNYYAAVPITLNYYLVEGLAIKAGIQPGFCVSKKYDYEVSTGIAGQTIISEQGKVKIEDGIKSFQFAIPVGLSYEFSNVVVDARYNWGLTKMFKDVKARNSVFQFTVGYKFEL